MRYIENVSEHLNIVTSVEIYVVLAHASLQSALDVVGSVEIYVVLSMLHCGLHLML